jgi:hypothetical protein
VGWVEALRYAHLYLDEHLEEARRNSATGDRIILLPLHYIDSIECTQVIKPKSSGISATSSPILKPATS